MRAVADSTPDELRPSFIAVVDRMAAGQRLADALGALNDGLGTIAEPLVDSLAAAERYGLPLAPVLDRLADEARSARRRQAEAAARQLPVRLAAPLVLCTLPSFVLLAIVPLLLGTFNSLHT
jgi:tight adherence protein C